MTLRQRSCEEGQRSLTCPPQRSGTKTSVIRLRQQDSYLVGSSERSHQQGDVLHHSQVMLQLLQLLVEPTRTQEGLT